MVASDVAKSRSLTMKRYTNFIKATTAQTWNCISLYLMLNEKEEGEERILRVGLYT